MRTYYIYKHTNLINGKVYIGQTVNPTKRWNSGKGYAFNKVMFNDILQYGWDNFRHEILEQTDDLKTASDLENFYIEKFNATDPLKGYNSALVDNVKSHKLNNKHSKPVSQYTISGQYLTTFPSAAEAERQTGVNYAQISDCCHSKRRQAGGYQWKFEKQEKIEATVIGKKLNTTPTQPSTRKTKIQMFNQDGSLLGEYKSAMDASRQTGISVVFIRTSCLNRHKKPTEIYFKKVSVIAA